MVRTIRVTGADGAEPPHPAATHAMATTYAWGQAAFTNASATGYATIQSGRDNLYVRWEEGLRRGDGHEREISYQRYLDTRLSLVAGYRFGNLDGDRDGPFAGAAFRLPYFVDLGLTQQSGGNPGGLGQEPAADRPALARPLLPLRQAHPRVHRGGPPLPPHQGPLAHRRL